MNGKTLLALSLQQKTTILMNKSSNLKNLKPYCFAIMLLFLFIACQQPVNESQQAPGEGTAIERVMSPEERSELTPSLVVQRLQEGNERFRNNDLTKRDHSKQLREAVLGQFPKAIVLTCIDSRLPVEDVFDTGIGDIFVARVGGNVVNDDILGSMEFACRVSGAKLVVILGHEHCETVVSAIDRVELGNMTSMISKIQPSIEKVKYQGKRSSINPEFVELVVRNNVENAIKDVREKSAVLKNMEESGEIQIIGAYYDLDEGKVFFSN